MLLFNMAVSKALKPRYQWAVGTLPILCMFGGFVPLIFFASWSAHLFGMTMHEPVRSHPNGWLWGTIFLAAMVTFMLTGCFIGYLLNGLICRTWCGWSGEKVHEVFWQSKVPAEWLNDGAALETSTKELDKELQKGVWHFVLARGILGWGLAMFGAMALPGMLKNPARVSFSFVFWQVLLWGLAGALFGYVTWLVAKKKAKSSSGEHTFQGRSQ